ncbi:metal-sensing transcriptional repressor, partial [Arthrospira platensis SPKY1]|nr:metal-sensing transcriptional repressor [Arthrospira platensis SPKY1]
KVIAMIEAGTPCLETAQQLHAVHRAVGNAKNLYVRDHIEHCMAPSAVGDLKKARRVIEEIREMSKYL